MNELQKIEVVRVKAVCSFGFSADFSVSGGNEVADSELSSGLVDNLIIDIRKLMCGLILLRS